ncbi:glycoside hydrolase family 15 protein [Homoserinibacter sp. GY 40078]|uniref:glycoside hydrolase family 15 protein n=1 Tax=Homoserinibacter sp. GY 40078 TaxID=2603275 RepID=UPI0011C9588C|nr:glycoside hydrolase family 15 protein [Homoserinibacter sp. GY 40078]TXK19810.1 glycoside hydrolase family 15 protein [Homoserinibacter sp. GY 40078]
MAAPIEDYALLSDARTAALVSRDGSIDWLCLPRFDSPSVFGALLGDGDHGSWELRPSDPDARATRHYDDGTFTLVTRWETAAGVAEVHELLVIDDDESRTVGRTDLVRRVRGVEGSVEFAQSLRLRFDYARAVPWVRQRREGQTHELVAIAGPDAVILRGARLEASDHVHVGTLRVDEGDTADLVLTWHRSSEPTPEALDIDEAIAHTSRWWRRWSDRIDAPTPHHREVIRSLLVLRALSHRDTGGIVAAATTSLPEAFGGVRNWDYRYVWLRDAALTLEAFIAHGFLGIAEHWRTWLLRAIAGDPAQMQIMYGIAGERDLWEREITSLPGYDGASPVRIGNDAASQYQADVIGEVLVALDFARESGLAESEFSWPLQRALLDQVVERLDQPDHGIWEIRGEPRMFTHSRAMIWAAFDRGVRAVREHGMDGPAERWEGFRERMRAEIDAHGVADAGHFRQSYDDDEVDASLLVLTTIGFCEPDDPRMLATVARIEETLMRDGLVHRYRTSSGVDGLPGDEHPFIACSFWLVEQYAATGRLEDAHALMDRACGLANDVGLLSEEYDTARERHAGNTPQALSHLALVRAADALAAASPGS